MFFLLQSQDLNHLKLLAVEVSAQYIKQYMEGFSSCRKNISAPGSVGEKIEKEVDICRSHDPS